MEERGFLLWMHLLALGNGAIAGCMEVTPEGLFVCRGLSHPTSTACHRDGHPQIPRCPGRCWWHLAEARLGQGPPCQASVSPAVKWGQHPQDALQGAEILLNGGSGSSYSLSLPGPTNWDMDFPGVPRGPASPTSQVGTGCHCTDTCSSDGCVLWSQQPAQSPGRVLGSHPGVMSCTRTQAQPAPTPCRVGSG